MELDGCVSRSMDEIGLCGCLRLQEVVVNSESRASRAGDEW